MNTTRKPTWREKLAAEGLRPVKEVAYPYFQPNRVKVARKARFKLVDIETGEVPTDGRRTKTFLFRHRPDPIDQPNAWKSGIGPYGDWLMYRLPSLMEALRNGKDVYWCEGEKDAVNALEAYGICTTSQHQGSAPTKSRQADWFAGSQSTIHLVMDRDERGQQVAWDHAKRLRRDAGIPWDRIVFLFPAVRDNKADLTDHIEAGYGIDDLRDITPEEMAWTIERIGELPRRAGKAGTWGSGGVK